MLRAPGLGPVWLLDVDGVINVNKPGWGAAPSRAISYSGGMEHKFRWAPALLRRIRNVQRAGVEIRWCSTWCDDPDELLRMFRLDFPCALDAEKAAHHDVNAYKLMAAEDVILAEHRPLIWTDDMALPRNPFEWEVFLDADIPWLFLQPRDNRGLQPEHMDYIEDWAHKWRAR